MSPRSGSLLPQNGGRTNNSQSREMSGSPSLKSSPPVATTPATLATSTPAGSSRDDSTPSSSSPVVQTPKTPSYLQPIAASNARKAAQSDAEVFQTPKSHVSSATPPRRNTSSVEAQMKPFPSSITLKTPTSSLGGPCVPGLEDTPSPSPRIRPETVQEIREGFDRAADAVNAHYKRMRRHRSASDPRSVSSPTKRTATSLANSLHQNPGIRAQPASGIPRPGGPSKRSLHTERRASMPATGNSDDLASKPLEHVEVLKSNISERKEVLSQLDENLRCTKVLQSVVTTLAEEKAALAAACVSQSQLAQQMSSLDLSSDKLPPPKDISPAEEDSTPRDRGRSSSITRTFRRVSSLSGMASLIKPIVDRYATGDSTGGSSKRKSYIEHGTLSTASPTPEYDVNMVRPTKTIYVTSKGRKTCPPAGGRSKRQPLVGGASQSQVQQATLPAPDGTEAQQPPPASADATSTAPAAQPPRERSRARNMISSFKSAVRSVSRSRGRSKVRAPDAAPLLAAHDPVPSGLLTDVQAALAGAGSADAPEAGGTP